MTWTWLSCPDCDFAWFQGDVCMKCRVRELEQAIAAVTAERDRLEALYRKAREELMNKAYGHISNTGSFQRKTEAAVAAAKEKP